MGIKMDLGEADKQAQSAKEVMAERIAAYDQLLGAIDLLLAADDLQGQAYDNIKNYAEDKLRPLALGAQLLAQGVGPATEKSPTDFRSQVGGESLDEDELVKEIEAYNQTIDVAEEYQAILKKSNALAVADPSGGQAALAAVAAQIDGLTAERDALQTKLDKLRAWAAGTATVCNEVHPLEAAVKQGVAEISQDMASFSGSFPTLQKGQSPDWVKTINKYLEAEEKTKVDNQSKKVKENGAKKVVEIGIGLTQTSITEITNNFIENKIGKIGTRYGASAAERIFNNRYSLTLPNGRNMGRTPGATKAAAEAAENGAKSTAKWIGRGITESLGLFVGVGMDMATGDTAEEAWGKEITTSVVTASTIGAIEAGSSALVSVGLMSNPIGIGILGTIAIGAGIAIVNDILRDNFKEVREFEDSVGKAVVNGWNSMTNSIGDFFGEVGKVFS